MATRLLPKTEKFFCRFDTDTNACECKHPLKYVYPRNWVHEYPCQKSLPKPGLCWIHTSYHMWCVPVFLKESTQGNQPGQKISTIIPLLKTPKQTVSMTLASLSQFTYHQNLKRIKLSFMLQVTGSNFNQPQFAYKCCTKNNLLYLLHTTFTCLERPKTFIQMLWDFVSAFNHVIHTVGAITLEPSSTKNSPGLITRRLCAINANSSFLENILTFGFLVCFGYLTLINKNKTAKIIKHLKQNL